MSDNFQVNSAFDFSSFREAVCIHTKKICDACIDKDCAENLRVYLTRDSQSVLDCANNAKVRCVELLHVAIDVDSLQFNCGTYTIDITYYYRIMADAIVNSTKPCTICGLAQFSKRVILCAGDSNARTFTSKIDRCMDSATIMTCNKPEAAVEVVDPMVLGSKVVDMCNCGHKDCEIIDLPVPICSCFDTELVLSGENKRLYVSIGQFSIVRLERDTQLLIPSYDYCLPKKNCSRGSGIGGCDENPCDLFQKIQFPVNSFFPPCGDGNCMSTGPMPRSECGDNHDCKDKSCDTGCGSTSCGSSCDSNSCGNSCDTNSCGSNSCGHSTGCYKSCK